MTGFAQARRERAGVSVTVTLKSGNQRYFDPRWQLPEECEAWQPNLAEHLRRAIRRGHIEVRISVARADSASSARLDSAAVEAYLAAHAQLSQRLDLDGRPSVADVLRFPGVWTAASGAVAAPDAATLQPLVLAAFEAALADLCLMRQREGAALALDVTRQLDCIAALQAEVKALRPAMESAGLARLRARMQELLSGAAVPQERMLQEAALLAERSDVSEELVRLEAHVAQCRALLAAGGEIGRRLDFLAQELNREANTLLAKTTAADDAALRSTALGLELKAAIERIREQVQNFE